MPGGVRLSGGPVLSETEVSTWESEVSSVISIGDRPILSETEDELADKNKYRLPSPGKTRLNLHTKEPLSPTPRQVASSSTPSGSKPAMPSTPQSLRGPPPPYESPIGGRLFSPSMENVNASDSELMSDLSRAGSVYSLGRISFSGQLSQLTNLRLPDASSLLKKISSIPTSTEAAKTLSDASEQIKLWISKAADVLQSLNADDDVEWAAAGGKDGIDDVDQAIKRFEKLVDVYVLSIERLQTRADVSLLSAAELKGSVTQMEQIIASWERIKQTLGDIKSHVGLAMDWEVLWNTVLGEIAQEIDGLNRLIFEMEEKRHRGDDTYFSSRDAVDLTELETIVEERPGRSSFQDKALGTTTPPLLSPQLPSLGPATPIDSKEDSSLLALFARMQPLRANLDFLPMRLSTFQVRANIIFPTACEELQDRRKQLETQWRKLECDAESLRRELGEDKWITVFRNAGHQAMKMCESITRTYNKLLDALDAGEQKSQPSVLAKKVESYEAKKLHYAPAVERVLTIIDKGVSERLTLNGEILRLQSEMKNKWSTLQASLKEMDSLLEDINAATNDKQLRDSVSTVMSSERSMLSSLLDTPGSSPASSVIGLSRKNSFQGVRTPMISTKATTVTPSTARSSSRIPSSSTPRRSMIYARTSIADFRQSPSPAPASTQWPSRPLLKTDNKPKWNASTKTDKRDFAPLSKFEPSPYAKPPAPRTIVTRPESSMRIPITNRAVSQPLKTAEKARSSIPLPSTPSVRASSALGHRTSANRLSVQQLPPASGRRSRLSAIFSSPSDGNEADNESPSRSAQRPLSSLAKSGRRSSMLPMRTHPFQAEQAQAGADRPAWRP